MGLCRYRCGCAVDAVGWNPAAAQPFPWRAALSHDSPSVAMLQSRISVGRYGARNMDEGRRRESAGSRHVSRYFLPRARTELSSVGSNGSIS